MFFYTEQSVPFLGWMISEVGRWTIQCIGDYEKIHERGIPFSMLIDSMDISGTQTGGTYHIYIYKAYARAM